MTTDGTTLDDVADELYAVPLGQFTPLRTQREKEAKAAGDKELAAQVRELRKPTVAAWLLNALARERRAELEPFLGLGEGLREAQAALQGEELRALSAQRHRLIAALVQQVRGLARDAGMRMTEDVERAVEQTLDAALADPAAAEALLAGRLVNPLQHVGFGGPAVPEAPARALRSVPPPAEPQRPRESATARRKREKEEREAREREQAEEAVRDAEESLHEAEERQARTTAQAAQADEAVEEAEGKVEELRSLLQEAEERLDQERRHAGEAAHARDRAAADVRLTRKRLDSARARLSALGDG
ncbi:hypothetical protein EV189_1653 [Motilibacter rhizosphaerae]|uniref:Uncharacterized protein n=1 Tax=Motilibacter rhizosphaerae TaxID=598652 RepID=A0A4Q7NS15_9ACTN|nr:hypothetical protein [Motilibacter rhizosphaerae]RZS89877.1 hypothetical protein EV189_1653 [Motilibacter rhizosphaerae]